MPSSSELRWRAGRQLAFRPVASLLQRPAASGGVKGDRLRWNADAAPAVRASWFPSALDHAPLWLRQVWLVGLWGGPLGAVVWRPGPGIRRGRGAAQVGRSCDCLGTREEGRRHPHQPWTAALALWICMLFCFLLGCMSGRMQLFIKSWRGGGRQLRLESWDMLTPLPVAVPLLSVSYKVSVSHSLRAAPLRSRKWFKSAGPAAPPPGPFFRILLPASKRLPPLLRISLQAGSSLPSPQQLQTPWLLMHKPLLVLLLQSRTRTSAWCASQPGRLRPLCRVATAVCALLTLTGSCRQPTQHAQCAQLSQQELCVYMIHKAGRGLGLS